MRTVKGHSLGLAKRPLVSAPQLAKRLQQPHQHVRNLRLRHLLADARPRARAKRHKVRRHRGERAQAVRPALRAERGPVVAVVQRAAVERVDAPDDRRAGAHGHWRLAVRASAAGQRRVDGGFSRVRGDGGVEAESCVQVANELVDGDGYLQP